MPNNNSKNMAAPITKETFLQSKQLDTNLFDRDDVPNLSAPLAAHSAFIFKHILSMLYLQKKADRQEEIARYHHGVQHANRVASLIPVWANLYKRYQHLIPDASYMPAESSSDDSSEDSLEEINYSAEKLAMLKPVLEHPISQASLHLLQIAALLHDAGREHDDEDLWEKDSAILCYLYLKKLGVSEKEALFFADVIANKDANPNEAQLLHVAEDGSFSWQTESREGFTLSHMLLHDADCLDIIRARDHFEAGHLYFDRTFAGAEIAALNDQAELITEMRSWIATQGDDRVSNKPSIKLQYEHDDGYAAMLASMDKTKYKTLSTLFNDGNILSKEAARELALVSYPPYDKAKGLEVNNLLAAMREGKLFSRSLVIPSGQSAKKITYPNGSTARETLAELELRKLARQKGVATSSSKGDNTKKDGNPHRSISMLGYGAATFSDAGFLLLDPPTENITYVSSTDSDTGFQKKQHMESMPDNKKSILRNLPFLLKELKQGGSSRRYGDFPSRHNELTCHLHAFDAVYYTCDPTARNQFDLDDPTAVHPYAPLLKAIYLQREYEKKFGVTLPIFEYSATHNSLCAVPKEECTAERIQTMWKEMVDACLKRLLTTRDGLALISKDNPELIKINALYGLNVLEHTAEFVDELLSVDINYAKELRETITNTTINAYKNVEDSLSLFEMLVLAASTDNLELFTHLTVALPLQLLAEDEQYFLMLLVINNNSKQVLPWILQHDTSKSLVNAMNEAGMTPLLYAIAKEDLDLVQLLLKYGANSNLENQYGSTPVLAAISKNQPEIVSALLNANADINQKSAFNRTPLAHAIIKHNKELVKILLEHGADPNIPCCEELITPLMVAVCNGTSDIERALFALKGEIEILEMLIAHGANVNSSEPISLKVLPRSRQEEKEELLKFFIPDTETMMFTPLQMAMFKSDSACMLALFKANAGLITTPEGKITLSTDYLPGDQSAGQLITKRYIENSLAAHDYFKGLTHCIEQVTDNESLCEIAENAELKKKLIEHGCLAALAKIATRYHAINQQPLSCETAPPLQTLMRDDNQAIFKAVNAGALEFEEKDEHGRMQYDRCENSKYTSHENDGLTETDNQQTCDYSAFNLDHVHFKKHDFTHSHWQILKSDHLRFSDCKLDGFSITPNSDLTRVNFFRPIFSNPEEAGKVAMLFTNMPLFIFENQYLNEVKKLREAGKKIAVNKQLFERFHQMIKKGEFAIFELLISFFKSGRFQTEMTDLLKHAMNQPGRATFADVILKNKLVDSTDLVAKQMHLNNHVECLEAQLEHVGNGKKARHKKNSLQDQLRFFKQKQDDSPSFITEQVFQYKHH